MKDETSTILFCSNVRHSPNDTRLAIGQRTDESLRLPGKFREQKRNDVAGVAVAVARNNDSGAMYFFGIGILQVNRHLAPNRNRIGDAEFDAGLSDSDGVRRKRQTRVGLGLV